MAYEPLCREAYGLLYKSWYALPAQRRTARATSGWAVPLQGGGLSRENIINVIPAWSNTRRRD